MMLEELRVSFKGVPGLVSPPAFAPVSDPAQLAEMNNAAVNCCKAATIWKNFGNVLSSISATITSGDHATAINTISGYNDASGTRVPGVIDKLGSPAYFSKPADQSRSEASYNSLVLPTNLMALLDLVSQSLTTGNASAANVYLRVAKDVQELYYITNRLAYNLAKGSMPNASFDITDLERNLAANFRQVGDDATSFISKLSTAITSIRQGIVSGKSYDALSVSGSLLFGLGKAITETDPTTSTTALSIDRFLLNNKAYQDAITGTTPGTGGPVTTPGAGYDLIHKKAFEKLLEANSAFASLERNKLIDSFERAYYDIFKGAGRVTESATVKKAREMLFVDGANISDAAVLEKLGLLTQMYFELGIKTSRNIIAKSDDEDQLKTLLGRKYEDITNKFGAIWGAAAIVNEDTQLQQD
ncbi:hypothetical protein FJZ26_05540, partial [Candidatus Parvarchaeota archaeon]|nr:hypothetical protein [Candidatus Parvarchaeota archaeon]